MYLLNDNHIYMSFIVSDENSHLPSNAVGYTVCIQLLETKATCKSYILLYNLEYALWKLREIFEAIDGSIVAFFYDWYRAFACFYASPNNLHYFLKLCRFSEISACKGNDRTKCTEFKLLLPQELRLTPKEKNNISCRI